MKNLMMQKGFTLTETLTVTVIIGILASVATPNYLSALDRAKITSVKGNMKVLESAVNMYNIDNGGFFPEEISDAFVQEYAKTDLQNPFTQQSGENFAYANINSEELSDQFSLSDALPGTVIYDQSTITQTNQSQYRIFGTGKTGELIQHNSSPFFLSNGDDSITFETVEDNTKKKVLTKKQKQEQRRQALIKRKEKRQQERIKRQEQRRLERIKRQEQRRLERIKRQEQRRLERTKKQEQRRQLALKRQEQRRQALIKRQQKKK